MLDRDEYAPPSFSLDLLLKDLDLALAASDGELEVTRRIADVARQASAAGYGGDDFAALSGFLARSAARGSTGSASSPG
jgi:3-hydroxyisobutyrate dehydrogenase-like beta-hydroxyacid dehydrogenase